MEVQLYIYDLTRGMARGMSRQLLGIQIDAVYHTSLVFNGIEYFYGMGVQTCYPGTTHHGQPMEIVSLGTSQLDMETIHDFLESLKQTYTAESYDLFEQNCNNFTNDFAQFLVGRGIPERITTLPRQVLDTPFGQMLRPQIDASMRSITQAPVPNGSQRMPSSTNGVSELKSAVTNDTATTNQTGRFGKVMSVTSLPVLDKQLQSASDTAAAIFFTSSTCAPCKLAYPMFDQLAEQHPQALFVKVDINAAHEIASRYQIRATPTFIVFSKGTKQDQWAGADPNLLKANVERLVHQTFPPHPHAQLRLPTLQFGSLKPVTYAKTPPLDKLMAKLGPAENENELVALRKFAETRSTTPQNAALPDMQGVSRAFQTTVLSLPAEIRFAAVDLLRCGMVDSRFSGWFAKEFGQKTVCSLVNSVNENDACPHSLRLVTIHLCCNLFSSPLFVRAIVADGNRLLPPLLQLITSSLLDAAHPTTRVASASLAFNLTVANYRARREDGRESLGDSEQVELAASLVEMISQEQSLDAVKALQLALGYLVYCAPENTELMDLITTLDAKSIVLACKGQETLAKEVAQLL